jgi:hypothetical protein
MKLSFQKYLIAGVVLLAGVLAVSAEIRGPYLGLVLDGAIDRFRVVPGTPSAAVVGPVAEFGTPANVAVYSPGGDYVAIQSAPTLLRIHRAAAVASLPTVDAFDEIILSPKGARAILLDRAAGRLIAVSGLPDSPRIAGRIVLPAHHGPLTSAAVSDQGTVLTGYAGSGVVLRLDGPALGTRRFARFEPVASFGRVSAMAFLRGREDALVADDLDDAVYLVRDVGGAPARSLVASRSDGVDVPVAVAASADGGRFFIADSGSRRVLVGSPDHAEVATLECMCTPSTLDPLIGDSVFGLTTLGGDSMLWVLDGGSAPPRLRLVPRSETGEVAP